MTSSVPQFASLYVGDLHPDVTEAMLYEIFNCVGPVASIRVCRDSVTRRSLGYGYVNFHGVSDAERALDTLNYSSIKGRSCRIMWSQRDPSLRKSGAGNIYVKNLDKNIDNKALYDTFSLFGNILSCKVAAGATGKSYGYGFVHYETEEAAKLAIERVDGMQIGEKTVHVCEFEKRGERDKKDITNYTNLYIKNFSPELEEDQINEMFSKFGSITSVAVRTDNKDRKFAFVNFDESASARKAVEEMHGKDMRNPEEIEASKAKAEPEEYGADGLFAHQLYVQRAQSKAERQADMKDKFQGASSPSEGRQHGVNLYVKNLDEETDEAGLRALFEPFGQITSVATPLDDRRKCKGFGFVCFESPDEATKAVTEMHLKVVQGKPLYVGLAEKREVRQERLKQRYQPGSGGGAPEGGKGGKGKGGGKGAGMPPQMFGGSQGQGFGQGGMMPPMMGFMGMQGMQGMPGMPGMQGMMRPQMMGMMAPQMGKGGPQMMGMMGKGGPMMGGQMMSAMGKGGQMGGPKGGLGMMPPMNMMRPPNAQQGIPRPGHPMQQQPAGGPCGSPPASAGPLSAAALNAAPPSVQKQMIGEKLYPAITKYQPELAGKITGMMLEMDNTELLTLLDSEQQLKNKVDEALRVLETGAK